MPPLQFAKPPFSPPERIDPTHHTAPVLGFAVTLAVASLLGACGDSTERTSIVERPPGEGVVSPATDQEASPLPTLAEGDDVVRFSASSDEVPARPVAVSSTTQLPASAVTVLSSDALFSMDSAELAPEATDRLSDFVNSLPDGFVTVRVEGFTDWRGDDSYNAALSQQRAENVASIVRSAVGARGTVVALGRGECCTSGTSREAMSHDRRVEITVTVAQ